MTTYTTEQTIELMRLINIAIYKVFGWLSEDKKEDLASVSYIALCEYESSAEYPEDLPYYPYVRTTVIRQAYNPDNYIVAVSHNRTPEEDLEEQELVDGLNAIKFELNFDGEESKYSNSYREVSYEQLVAETGFEVSTPCIEQQIIERHEETLYELQVDTFKNSPMFNAILISAIDHVENGGTFKTFAENMGYSPQSLKNLIRRRVDQSNDPNNVMLPFAEYMFNDAPKVKKSYKQPVRFADTSVQLSLF